MIHAALPCKANAGNGTQIGHPFVDSRYMCVRVEHENSICKEKANILMQTPSREPAI
jgi:hypothetical protein